MSIAKQFTDEQILSYYESCQRSDIPVNEEVKQRVQAVWTAQVKAKIVEAEKKRREANRLQVVVDFDID